MHIVIPMSGTGQRFVEAGYTTPKPFIEIDGMPIIEHVMNLFPGENKFTFICSQALLDTTNATEILRRIAPQGEVVAIAPHKKGPVFAVAQVFDKIDDDEEVIVNYCDFSIWWSYQKILEEIREAKADGAVMSYKGFHPHMLGSTHYAFIRNDGPWLLEIREKQPFTDKRMEEYASCGMYYFRTGAIVKRYFQQTMDLGIEVNGEFYASVVYNLLVRDGLKVYVPEIEHMLQWGTPEDVEQYTGWSDIFRAKSEASFDHQSQLDSTLCVLPMAGRGERFSKAGYSLSKPLIPVHDKPMFVEALSDLPSTDSFTLVVLKQLMEDRQFLQAVKQYVPNARLVPLESVTQGQAETCEIALEGVDPNTALLIGACDNGNLSNDATLKALLEDPSVDAIAWSFRGHHSSRRNPQMYGWLDADDDGTVRSVSVKQAISEHPENDHAIVGTFYFRRVQDYLDAVSELRRRDQRVNGEFYVDSLLGVLIDQGKTVKVFEVDHYICWGTPDDYETYQYWDSFFTKCWWHPYKQAGALV